jgi:hypothetical protein
MGRATDRDGSEFGRVEMEQRVQVEPLAAVRFIRVATEEVVTTRTYPRPLQDWRDQGNQLCRRLMPGQVGVAPDGEAGHCLLPPLSGGEEYDGYPDSPCSQEGGQFESVEMERVDTQDHEVGRNLVSGDHGSGT